MSYVVRNWKKHQHFKDRRPPWIKLYRDILDDMEWHALSGDAAKCLVMLWLLASEDKEQNGKLPTASAIAFRLRMPEDVTLRLISQLSAWLIQDDDKMMTSRYQVGPPETETETEGEGETYTEAMGGSTPPRDGLLGLADKIRGCRPEYRAIKEQSIVNSLSAVQDRQALEAELEIWIAEHSNMLVAMNNPMASLHKLIYRLCRKESENGAR